MNLSELTPKHHKKNATKFLIPVVIAASALSLTGGTVLAQKGLDFGVKGCLQTSSLLNSSDQTAGPELNYKNKVNAAFGISGGYNFNEYEGVELNVLFSKQGQGYDGDATKINANSAIVLSSEFQNIAKLNGIAFSGTYTANVNLTYIKIPILFRYTGNNTQKVFFSSFIGPQIDMLSAATIQVNNTDAPKVANGLKPSDVYKKTSMDGVLGLGAGFNLSKNMVLSAHLRLDFGFADAEDKSAAVGGANFYNSGRAASHNATGGGLISLNYKLLKKAKSKTETKTTTKSKK